MKEIKLSQGKVALVDDADFEWLNQWKWFYHRAIRNVSGYAIRNIGKAPNRSVERMHTLIMGKRKGHTIDHINRNGLDNRRENLRWANSFENIYNRGPQKNCSSGFKGVSKTKDRYGVAKYWIARITVGKNRIYLGTFPTPEEANAAYVEAAKKYHREFSYA
jgi:hypothetical protein